MRLRRQALCRLEVRGFVFITGVSGEPNISKVNWELFIGEVELASFSCAVSSEKIQTNENWKMKCATLTEKVYDLFKSTNPG